MPYILRAYPNCKIIARAIFRKTKGRQEIFLTAFVSTGGIAIKGDYRVPPQPHLLLVRSPVVEFPGASLPTSLF